MAQGGTLIAPGTNTGLNIEKWSRTVQFATYQAMQFIPTIEEGDRPYSLLHDRKYARVAAATFSRTASGVDLTYVNPIGTPVTFLPAASVVPVAWAETFNSELDINLNSELVSNLEGALAESTEQTRLADVVALTKKISDTGVTAPMLRKAMARLAGNTNGYAMVGKKGGPTIYGGFHTNQYPNLANIPEVNSAEMRGDSENPYVRGIWAKGFGFSLWLNTVITQDANGWHKVLYVPSAFRIAWNTRTLIKRQDDELQNRLILYNNLAGGVLNDLRAIDVVTSESAE